MSAQAQKTHEHRREELEQVWQEAELQVVGDFSRRRGEIGRTPDMPDRLAVEACGLGYLLQRLRDDLAGEEWTTMDLESMRDTAVDLAASAERMAEAFEILRLRRRAVDQGSSIPWVFPLPQAGGAA